MFVILICSILCSNSSTPINMYFSIQTVTGDVLVQSAAAAKAVRKGLESKGDQADLPVVLQGLKIPEPAFFCTIEPATAAQQTGTVCVCV